MKYAASLLRGVFAGLAGAHLSRGYLTMFTENISGSRGFIAVACVIFGASNPPRVFAAALLFGFIDALGMRLQSVDFNYNLTSMAHYVVTVVMMVPGVLRANHRKRNWRGREKSVHYLSNMSLGRIDCSRGAVV